VWRRRLTAPVTFDTNKDREQFSLRLSTKAPEQASGANLAKAAPAPQATQAME